MKTASANDIKHHRVVVNTPPRDGSHMRFVYDQFLANKGKAIAFPTIRRLRLLSDITRLRDNYGLDIRHFGRGRYCLVGEWAGSKYIDYYYDNYRRRRNNNESQH